MSAKALSSKRAHLLRAVLVTSALAFPAVGGCGGSAGDAGADAVVTGDGLAFPTLGDQTGAGDAGIDRATEDAGPVGGDAVASDAAAAAPDADAAGTGPLAPDDPAVWWRSTVAAATWTGGGHTLTLRVGPGGPAATFEDSEHRLALRPGSVWQAPLPGER